MSSTFETISIVITGIFVVYAIFIIRKKITTNDLVIGGMLSALSYILYLIHIIRYPQGGGITLFSMLPIMVLSLIRGVNVGLIGGLIFGILKMLNGFVAVHIIQFLLDYILSTMALGLAGIFGYKNKRNIIAGCSVAVFVSVILNVISGVIFFGKYAPEGMNTVLYSFIYNFSSAGIEGILTIILIYFIPIKRFVR